MSIKKRSTGAIAADATPSVGLGAAYALIRRVDVVSSADTSTAVTITDRDGVVIYTLASGDHTTKKRQVPVAKNAGVKAADGSAASAAETELVGGPVIARSPVGVAITGIGSGTVTVDLFVESDRTSV
jgi:ribosomal protein S11